MKLTYTNAEQTVIEVVLDEGESLGLLHGPVTATVPVDPLNADYAAIEKEKLVIEPFQPPEAAKET